MEEQKPPQHHTHVNVTNVINNRASARVAVRRAPRRRRPKWSIPPILRVLVIVVLFVLLIRLLLRSGQERKTYAPARIPDADAAPTSPALLSPDQPVPQTTTASEEPEAPRSGSFFLQFGESRTFTTASYSHLRVTSDWPIKIDFGDCHSSPTREYDCETDPSSQLTLTDSRVASMPESPRNEVKIEFSNQ
jgi:hypothetical protein